ncbi:hypothetical protein JCM17846_05430 [Iodidimonas nitroreducens]|uniref:Uncharacterized protein n=1 Tax=Iodidimonas nitroreducens TaxID=1236968 RepID=A0A5A7N3L8_9PROT|nr:hypothetical protein [Iodidimonas nitroreducens]GER02861.1 hypothetical protein JCM17846_05430 [Iodidimonas nitroreducens]
MNPDRSSDPVPDERNFRATIGKNCAKSIKGKADLKLCRSYAYYEPSCPIVPQKRSNEIHGLSLFSTAEMDGQKDHFRAIFLALDFTAT